MPTNPLGRLMKRSPLKYLQEHMRVALECAREVPPLLQAQVNGDLDTVQEKKQRIFELEAEADRIKNELRAGLPKSLFIPVDRGDLLDVLRMQDSIADTAQDIAGLLIERPMEAPESLKSPLVELANRCIDVCEQSLKVIEELDELLEMGFRGAGSESGGIHG